LLTENHLFENQEVYIIEQLFIFQVINSFK